MIDKAVKEYYKKHPVVDGPEVKFEGANGILTGRIVKYNTYTVIVNVTTKVPKYPNSFFLKRWFGGREIVSRDIKLPKERIINRSIK